MSGPHSAQRAIALLGTCAMFAVMFALLWSGLSLSRRMSITAFVVFTVSALMELPFALLGLALAMAD